MRWKMSAAAASFPSSPPAPAFISARFWKDSPTRQPGQKNSAIAFAQKFRRAVRSICTGCSTAWIAKPPRRIAPRDTQKIIRAIEMRILAGKAVGEIHRSGRSGLAGHTVTKIGLSPPRDRLYAKIDARVNAMIAAGWVDEVRSLVEMGVPAGRQAVSVHRLLGFARSDCQAAARPLKRSRKSSRPRAVSPSAKSPGSAKSRTCIGSPDLATTLT